MNNAVSFPVCGHFLTTDLTFVFATEKKKFSKLYEEKTKGSVTLYSAQDLIKSCAETVSTEGLNFVRHNGRSANSIPAQEILNICETFLSSDKRTYETIANIFQIKTQQENMMFN